MKCQYCNQNEAESSFIVSDFMNHQHKIHLCNECVNKFTKYISYMGRQHSNGAQLPIGWGIQSSFTARREVGADNFPTDAGESVRQRRRLNELYYQLKNAATKEEYEKAGKLRDEIKKLEKKV